MSIFKTAMLSAVSALSLTTAAYAADDVAAADAVDETNVAATVAELERLGQELAQRRRARLQALRQLDAEGKLDGDAAADLALLLATLVVPNVAHLLAEQAATLDRLRDVAR